MKRVALLVLLGVASCHLPPEGPVVGSWRGEQPTFGMGYYKQVELTLEGQPGATSGRYRFRSLNGNPQPMAGGSQDDRWEDRWSREDRMVDGRQVSIIHLHDMLGTNLDTYAIGPGGALYPVLRNGLPDTSRDGAINALRPVTLSR